MNLLSRLEQQAGLETGAEHLNPAHAALLARMEQGDTAYYHPSFAKPEARTLGGSCRFWCAQAATLLRAAARCALDVIGKKNLPWCGQKEAGRAYPASYTGPAARLRFHWHNLRAKRKGRALKKKYDRKAAANAQFKPKPGIRYLFFALHYQPECTTNPLGGIFTDAYLAVNMLVQSLPAGWELLVKEHSAQFFTDYPEMTPYQGHIPRPAGYYDLIAASARVHLLPLHFSSPAVLEWCDAIATVTGTVGVEAIWRGKPALVFGDAFYNALPGVFPIRSLEDCVRAMQQIDQGVRPGKADLIRFLDELELHQCEIGLKADFRDRSWTGDGDGFADALAGALQEASGQSGPAVRLRALLEA